MLPVEAAVKIQVHDLYKSFDGVGVLRGVDLEVHDNETMVIIGLCCSGNSALLKHLCGLPKPDACTMQKLILLM